MKETTRIGISGSLRPVVSAYVGLTLLLLLLPLVNVLHAESCAVLAAAAFFFGGIDAIRRFQSGIHLKLVLARGVLLLLIPLWMFQIARFVLPGCDLVEGLRYFLLFPIVSVLLATSLAYVLTAGDERKAVRRFVGIGLLTVVLTLGWDLGFHPQFYVYNHIFGGVLGPIYDLHLSPRLGLYVFRGLTLLWACFLLLLGFRIRNLYRRRLTEAMLLVVGALIGLAYLFGPRLGINTTHTTISDGLGSSIKTEHFVIHYDERVLPEPEVRRLAEDHEFRYVSMEKELGFSIDGPILSYVYPTASIRAQLTGAGYTNVAPVWLRRPQVHVLYESYDRSFAHELAHVFSRDMGLPLLRASLRVGLVEGFAVAMEPPIGLPSATDQVAAIRNAPEFDSLYAGQSLASAVVSSLSPFGFWSGRGAVSYTTMGSFVRYLLDTYGPEPFEEVYGMASFESAYGVRLTDLAEGWEASLIGRELPPSVADLAASRFSVLSIFERHCPHDTPVAVRRYWDALDLMQLSDTANARVAIDDVLKRYPDFAPVLAIWARLELESGGAAQVVHRLNPVLSADSSLAAYLGLVMGDARAMEGKTEDALIWYRQASEWQSPFSRTTQAILRLRTLLVADSSLVAAMHAQPSRALGVEILSKDEAAVARIMASLLIALDNNHELALELIQETEGTDASTVAGARWYAWAASFAYRSGNYEEAERRRQQAVAAAKAETDLYEVTRLEDFGRRIKWAQSARHE